MTAIPPSQTLYVNNLNDKINKKGKQSYNSDYQLYC